MKTEKECDECHNKITTIQNFVYEWDYCEVCMKVKSDARKRGGEKCNGLRTAILN